MLHVCIQDVGGDGGGYTFYNGLYGHVLLKRATFFRPKVCKMVRISGDEV